ncbi:MAG TPA: trehalase family glycosidase [Verrucomicrobiae bacterium]|nr:trehalase family glycosidase [Verrucomicrobiae bacterium]
MRRLAPCIRVIWFVPVIAILAAGNPAKIISGRRGAIAAPAGKESFESLDDMLRYISADWTNLSRSLTKCETLEDPKISGEPVLYFPAGAAIPAELADLPKRCSVRLAHLPAKISAADESDISEIHPPGLLYLENSYVVPGGQFNEMYGWDSYFIIRGLLRDGRRDMARGMVENFFYEIQHYGGVLNANRTYYLGRSQPPFLSSMILAVYQADKAAGSANLEWLRRAYAFAVSDYEQWNQPPHLAGDTQLSRYFDAGNGPVPEIMGDPSHYYREVMHYFLIHEGEDSPYLVRIGQQQPASSVIGPIFDVSVCDTPAVSPGAGGGNCAPADRVALTADFYKGDRSMRESGFDVTFRFGPFGAETHHYAPVGLNSLLYKTEKDLEEMSLLLGNKEDAERWQEKAAERRERMDKYMWDPGRGIFFDYDFVTHKRSTYDYATTFYPLWAGLATKEQARAIAANSGLFERPGGLAMSRNDSEAQWDYPYGWAPIQLLAVEGLRRYGYAADADRISREFISMVLDNFRRDHTLREKYNVVTRSAETQIEVGYAKNMIGFGWTNGVVLELLHEAPPELAAELRKD